MSGSSIKPGVKFAPGKEIKGEGDARGTRLARWQTSTVKYRIRILLWSCLVGLPSVAWAQDVEFSGNDDPSVTTSLGIPLSVPLAPMRDHVGFAWGVSAGVGYNFDRRNALIDEFMWNALYPTNETLQPIGI